MTAVEWLENEMQKTYAFNQNDFDMFKKAKELEKQQIIDAALYGFREDAEAFDWKGDKYNSEQYYNETFKNK